MNIRDYIIPASMNRSHKLTDEDRVTIRTLYATGNHSQRNLAKQYNVSKSLIAITVNPDRAAAVKERRASMHAHYYDKNRHSAYVNNHRTYKRQLLQADKLIPKE